MKRYVEFRLEQGGTVVVEANEPESSGTTRAARPNEIAEAAGTTFEQALSIIQPTVSAIISKLRDLTDPPDQAEAEFGLKLGGKVNAVIASGSSEANFKIKLTWKRHTELAVS